MDFKYSTRKMAELIYTTYKKSGYFNDKRTNNDKAILLKESILTQELLNSLNEEQKEIFKRYEHIKENSNLVEVLLAIEYVLSLYNKED